MTLKVMAIALFVFACASVAQARVLYFGSEPELLTLLYGGPTLIRFPSEVKTISQSRKFEIIPASTDEPNYALLSVTPRSSDAKDSVVFVLADGSVIKTKLVTVPKAIAEKTDSIYELKSKETLVERDDSQGAPALSEVELMKAMIRGDQVSGYELKGTRNELTPGFRGLKTTLVRVYTGSQFNGYIFELQNLTKTQKLFINIQNLVLGDPNVAVLSNIDRSTLDPGDGARTRTLLRIVAKPTSQFQQLQLPVEVAERASR